MSYRQFNKYIIYNFLEKNAYFQGFLGTNFEVFREKIFEVNVKFLHIHIFFVISSVLFLTKKNIKIKTSQNIW